jgi:hypothetical protein
VESGTIARRMLHPPPLSGKADLLVEWSLTDEERLDEENPGRAMKQAEGFGGKFQDSHVLLSACGKEQTAREKNRSGIFTNALMKVLEEEFGPTKQLLRAALTYSTLMAYLNMPELCVPLLPSHICRRTDTLFSQTPHCEGSNINKVLFTRQGSVSDPLFIPCRKTKMTVAEKQDKWILTLDAGTAQGIAPGELFSIHANDLPVGGAKTNPEIGFLIATEVNTATSLLNYPDPLKKFPKGKHFYARRVDWSKDPPKIFCEDSAWLDKVFPLDDPKKKIVRVDNKGDAQVILELTSQNKVRFLRSSQAFLDKCQVPSFTVSTTRHKAIRAAVGGLQHFNSHLHRQGTKAFPEVRMEMHFLEPERQADGRDLTPDEAQLPENFKLTGSNLLVDELTILKLPDPEMEEKPLGVTLYNDGDHPIYPYLFYFDPNDLTISEYFAVIPSPRYWYLDALPSSMVPRTNGRRSGQSRPTAQGEIQILHRLRQRRCCPMVLPFR